MCSARPSMLTRALIGAAVTLAACASPAPSHGGLKIETVPGQPRMVRLVLDPQEAFRLSRAGVMDRSSPSGLTDPIGYRAAIEQYTAAALAANGLCPRGYGDLRMEGGDKSYATAITVVCLPP
jgi:hypothetical protein